MLNEDYKDMLRELRRFGAPLHNLTNEDLQRYLTDAEALKSLQNSEQNVPADLCHYLNTRLMMLGGSKDDLAQDLRSLNALIEDLATGENFPEGLKQMQASME